MFDTHCHLNSAVFDKDVAKVVNSARKIGVSHFLIPGTDIPSSQRALDITEDFQNIYASVGVHPTEDLEKMSVENILIQLEDFFKESLRIIAIGEIGLDYYRYIAGPALQKKFFTEQVKLAIKLGKPVIIHNRHSTEDIISCLDEIGVNNLSGQAVFHCCPAEKTLLDYAIKHRIFIGVDGDVTYDSAKKDFIKEVPLDLLLLETDSPYLTPEPARSERKFPNEPMNLSFICAKVSHTKSISKERVSEATTKNAHALFGTM